MTTIEKMKETISYTIKEFKDFKSRALGRSRVSIDMGRLTQHTAGSADTLRDDLMEEGPMDIDEELRLKEKS